MRPVGAAVTVAWAALTMGTPALAEVVQPWEGGFTSRNVAEVAAGPERIYAALGEIGRWWSDAHTYSGAAANFTLPLEVGGCWCEALPGGGGVSHATVVLAWPQKGLLRLDAALGPMREAGATGVLTWEIKPKGAGSEVVQTFTVAGAQPTFVKGAAAVDAVMTEALQRLERYVETGKP